MILGLVCIPIAFVDWMPERPGLAVVQYLALMVASPVGVAAGVAAWGVYTTGSPEILVEALERIVFGWSVWGSWGLPVGILLVWWPAWFIGMVLVASSWYTQAGL